jgi:integral membrane protein
MSNPVMLLRWAGLIEAVSFILLVGIAMPLKYVWGKPEAVRVVGMAHGILFILFCIALARVMIVLRWPLGRGAFVFLMAVVPFGPFLIDGKLKRHEREALSR